jgi:hypothetical protein
MATNDLFGMDLVPKPFEFSGLGDEPKPKAGYSQDLLNQAMEKYPFVGWNNPAVAVGRGQGYAETFPVGEVGGAENPRPVGLPMGQVGVEVYKPSQFTPEDLAAEMLHVDRYANQVRDYLKSSLTPKQMNMIKQESLDYRDSLNAGLSEEMAVQNAVDAALRGYVVGQWPDEVHQRIGYTPEQKKHLDDLAKYMKNFGR